jgi:hypothetical protein
MLLSALACSANDDAVARGRTADPSTPVSQGGSSADAASGGSNSAGSSANGLGGTGEAAGTGNATGSGGSPAAGGSPGTGGEVQLHIDGGAFGAETQCDGVDNDGNGIIDDVDVARDGVCDCLNIATIGRSGPSGQANLFGAWLNSRSSTGAVSLGDQELTPRLLQPFQVVVLLEVLSVPYWRDKSFSHVYTPTEAAALSGWVHAGGGLMTTSGYTQALETELADTNRLLMPLDVGYDTVSGWDVTGYIQQWSPHSITEGISKIYTALGAEPLSPAGLEPLAWDAQGQVALAAKQLDSGRIAMWADEWITFDSQWQGDPQVELFWLRLLKWLSPIDRCQVPIPSTIY